MTARSPQWLQANRAIRAACAKAGIGEDDRKAIVARLTGKASMADCTAGQLGRVLAELNTHTPKPRVSGKPYVRKIFGLWAEAGKRGAIGNPSREALLTFVRRMTKSEKRPDGLPNLGALEWLTAEEAAPIIEGLKGMIKRTKTGDKSNGRQNA